MVNFIRTHHSVVIVRNRSIFSTFFHIFWYKSKQHFMILIRTCNKQFYIHHRFSWKCNSLTISSQQLEDVSLSNVNYRFSWTMDIGKSNDNIALLLEQYSFVISISFDWKKNNNHITQVRFYACNVSKNKKEIKKIFRYIPISI